MSPRARRIVLAVAVLPLVALIGLRSVWAAYACRIDGEVREACCCPKEADKDGERAPTDGAPRVAAPCCCDVTVSESADAPQVHETDRAHANDVPFVLAAMATEPSAVGPSRTRTMSHAFARPPPRSVPKYLANRTILR